MRAINRLTLLGFLSILLSATPALAASKVNVRVFLANGAGPAGAGVTVQISDPSRGFDQRLETNGQSRVRFQNVPEGPKTVSAERPDGSRAVQTLVVSKKSQNVSLTLSAPPRAPQPSRSVNPALLDQLQPLPFATRPASDPTPSQGSTADEPTPTATSQPALSRNIDPAVLKQLQPLPTATRPGDSTPSDDPTSTDPAPADPAPTAKRELSKIGDPSVLNQLQPLPSGIRMGSWPATSDDSGSSEPEAAPERELTRTDDPNVLRNLRPLPTGIATGTSPSTNDDASRDPEPPASDDSGSSDAATTGGREIVRTADPTVLSGLQPLPPGARPEPPPPEVQLVAPGSGTTFQAYPNPMKCVETDDVELDWDPASGSVGYIVEVENLTRQGDYLYRPLSQGINGGLTTEWRLNRVIIAGHDYEWRVRGVNAQGTAGPWSSARRFSAVEGAPRPPNVTCGVAGGPGFF
jgi:hypothetical protein